MASKKPTNCKPRVRITGYASSDRHPEVAVYALDNKRKTIKTLSVNNRGEFDLPGSLLKKTGFLAIGPSEEDPQAGNSKSFALYRPDQVAAILERNGRFEIPGERWKPWLQVRRCVSGTVHHCHWHFFPLPILPLLPTLPSFSLNAALPRFDGLKPLSPTDSMIAYPLPPRLPHRQHCRPVCDGVIEVYRRNCCCTPWVIYDPRLDDLLAELERLRDPLDVFPPKTWPPRPQPDPSPIDPVPGNPFPVSPQGGPQFAISAPIRRSLFRYGTVDKMRLNAARDFQALQQLPASEIPAYISARPYLRCRCGQPRKVATGFVRSDGEFSICWREPLQLKRKYCHDEFSFVVKQVIDDETVTIYDGVTANRWQHQNEGIRLRSYHPGAAVCDNNEPPVDVEGAFVMLQDIGLAGSYRLKTPDAKGWDRVQPPALYNHGLADTVDDPAAAVGKLLNRNWGGTLRLRIHFSDNMKTLGALYYRVSVTAADSQGNPTGPRRYLSAPAWRYYEYTDSRIYVRAQSLGPHSVDLSAGKTQSNLYKIPLRFDEANKRWHNGQIHAALNTRDFANGRHLLTLEVFNKDGIRLRPQISDNPDDSTQANFTFQRWYQATGETAVVPYAALTHLFWWDNRRAEAKIVDLRVSRNPSEAQCQFLTAPAATGFSIGYRAYHPEPLFLLDHRLWTRRGLGGPVKYLTMLDPSPDAVPNISPSNVGVPPADPQQGLGRRFDDMLDSTEIGSKCSFSANLHANVKTFNGSGTLDGLDGWDQAAFALEIGTTSSS